MMIKERSTMELIAKAFPALLIVGGFFCVLAIGGIVADYCFPHSKWLNRFIDSLPMNWM